MKTGVHLELEGFGRDLVGLDGRRKGWPFATRRGRRGRRWWGRDGPWRGRIESGLEPGLDGEEDGKDLGIGCFVLDCGKEPRVVRRKEKGKGDGTDGQDE